jgi:ubiquinone biosynthesis protein Coq4
MAIIVGTMLGAIERRDLGEIADMMEQTGAGYQNGKRARRLYGVRWEDHWERDLAEVRREFSIEPFRAA